MSYQNRELEFVRDVSQAVISAPLECYAAAWGFNDNGNKSGNKGGDTSNPFLAPLAKPMSVLFKDMQDDLNKALKIDIYKL